MSDERYIFEPYKGKSSRYECPQCRRDSLVRFIDAHTWQQVADDVGKCNHKTSCGYILTPKQYFDDNGIETPKSTQPVLIPQPKPYFAHHRQQSKPIDEKELYFSEINRASKSTTNYYNLETLLHRLNSYKKPNETPIILKGIFENGIAGKHCEAPAPFLPFDLDVKKKENTILQNNPELNEKIFQYLEKYAVMIWRSKSQKGIAGLLYVPELIDLDKTQTETHLKKAKAIYSYLQMMIYKDTGILIKLDWQQGKFRQERQLAEQAEQRMINSNPAEFYTNHTPEQKLISNTLLGLFKQSLQPDKNLNQIAQHNNLIKYLHRVLGAENASKVISKYYLGTSKHWQGATVFWQIDEAGNIRNGKIILYDSETGKRVRASTETGIEKDCLTWLHSVTEIPEIRHKQCFFGEHLLKGNRMPVAIAESEKTAMIASVYLPQYIWLASGTIEGFSNEKCEVLKGRNVVLYPDLKAYDYWAERAEYYGFTINSFFEENATEIQKNKELDLADVLPYFKPPEPTIQTEPTPPAEPKPEITPPQPDESEYILKPFTSYSEAELIQMIMKATGRNEGKAKQGIQKLMNDKVIDITFFGAYYLYDSAPF